MRTSSDASRKRMRTREPVDRSVSSADGSSSRYSSSGPVPTTRATRSVVEPGACTSSDTLPISAGGRLSMTNHPRSSNVLAAFERPAPDNPVMSRNSVIASSRLPSALSYAEEQEAGNGGRADVLLGAGEEPRRWSGFLHALDKEAGRRHGVDVAREGS